MASSLRSPFKIPFYPKSPHISRLTAFFLGKHNAKSNKKNILKEKKTMAFIKKYEVGQINIDYLSGGFVHEIPLLAFKDVKRSVTASLLYLFDMTGNPYNISNGYKLNIQKRITFSSDGLPVNFEDGNGKVYNLSAFGSGEDIAFTFDDASQRIIRKTSEGYTLDYPDYSREEYGNQGQILAAYDKYNECYLTFTYTDSKLTTVTYRNDKTITIDYENGRMRSISYQCAADASNTVYTSTFIYDTNGDLRKIEHYSGVDYNFLCSISPNIEITYEVFSTNRGGAYSAEYSQKEQIMSISGPPAGYKISSFVGNKKVNERIYESISSYDDKHMTFDITDFNGIKNRTQCENGLPAYSYEICDEMFVNVDDNYYFNGNVKIHNSNKIDGTLTYSEGNKMSYRRLLDRWEYDFPENAPAKNQGYFILTGWLKPTANVQTCTVKVNSSFLGKSINIPVTNISPARWSFFAARISDYKFKDLNVSFDAAEGDVESRDFRVVLQQPGAQNVENTNLTNIEEILFLPSEANSAIVPFDKLEFFNGNTKIEENITYVDIVKYLTNNGKSYAVDEIYYDGCRGVIKGAEALYVEYNNEKYAVTSCAVGQRFLKGTRENLSKCTVNPVFGRENVFVITETYYGSYLISRQEYDKNFDVISTIDGFDCAHFERNEKGLVTSKSTSYPVYTYATYDNKGTKCLKTTDEQGLVTNYITDDTWGVVTTVIANGVTVRDSYDSDKSTLSSRTFSSNTGTRYTLFGYTNGNLSYLEQSGLTYNFGYTNENLTEVKKSGGVTENHLFTDNDKIVLSSYPSSAAPLYTEENKTDKYGRLKEKTGFVKNTYDIAPKYTYNEYSTLSFDNGSAILAESEDLVTNEKTKYGYNLDRLARIGVYDTSGSKKSEQILSYDTLGRLIDDEYVYDCNEGISVRGEIEYETTANSPNPDGRVKTYGYLVNEEYYANTKNAYDPTLKRLIQKSTKVGECTYGKTFIYDKSRLDAVIDNKNDSAMHKTTYTYDVHGRIVKEEDGVGVGRKNTYTYDGFGQLVRENNKLLDKTLVYDYNDIGNVIKVTVYGYTEGALGSVLSSKTFDYNTAKKDQLAVYNGSMLTYDANGCLKTAPGTVMNISGTVTYGWTGGRLTSASWGSTPLNACTYAYDGYGRRINKTHTVTVLGGSTPSQTIKSTVYTYDKGGRLICERISTPTTEGIISAEEKLYLYDEASVVGMIYTANGTTNTYYFDKDVFGNVLGIHNAQGIQQCCYVYDAFGNCKVLNPDGTVNISSTFIGNINPFRYKGYYYDKETCLYYLGTRYYCPDLCRFIQPADVSGLIPSTVNGLNLYAFANNNPIGIAYSSSSVDGSTGGGMVSSIGAGNSFTGNVNSGSPSKGGLNLGWLANGLDTGSTIHGLYTSISGLVNHTAYFAKNLTPFSDDMKMLGASMKDGVLAFNQFSWGLGKSDIFGIALGVGLDIYDSIQRGVSPGGVVLGATLTAAKGVGLIYLNKGILYGATALGSAICPGVGTVVGFVAGGVVCVFVDIFVSNWIGDLIDKIAK